LTKDVPQHLIVVLAVYLLGGAQRFVDTEDVAKKASELAPGRFSWRKYPDQINLELVRVFLSDAKKEAKGRLVEGSGRKGWTLTPEGLKWASETGADLSANELQRSESASRAGSVDALRRDRESSRIQSGAAWRKWRVKDFGITTMEARDVFRMDSYATGSMAALKVNRLRNLFINEPELAPFLAAMAEIVLDEEDKDGK
jgi:hypothetical protein